MSLFTLHIDERGIMRVFNILTAYVQRRAITDASDIVRDGILNRTKQGKSYTNRTFPIWTPYGVKKSQYKGYSPYSPSQQSRRLKGGFQTAKKDLRMSGNMLDSIRLMGNTLTVADEYQDIAHGQMFNPSWRYHHEFLSAGKADAKQIEKKIVERINSMR